MPDYPWQIIVDDKNLDSEPLKNFLIFQPRACYLAIYRRHFCVNGSRSNWKEARAISTPETVVGWHRVDFRLY
jgi:hypothetical protein